MNQDNLKQTNIIDVISSIKNQQDSTLLNQIHKIILNDKKRKSFSVEQNIVTLLIDFIKDNNITLQKNELKALKTFTSTMLTSMSSPVYHLEKNSSVKTLSNEYLNGLIEYFSNPNYFKDDIHCELF